MAAMAPTTRDPRPLVVAHGLARSVRGVQALDGIDLEVHGGEVVALLGGNGAGKTSLLELLAGVRNPSGGRVERESSARTRVGWIPQSPALYRQLTCLENLVFFARMAGVPDPAERASRLLHNADLDDVRDRRADALSTGMRQRLNIAVGLVDTPRLVLMDEPSATLSPDQQRRMWEWVRPAADEAGAIVFATQSLREARLYATRVVVLAAGRIVYDGSAAGIIEAFGAAGDTSPEDDALVRLLEAHR